MSPPAPDPAHQEFWTPRRFFLVLTAAVLAAYPKVILGLTTFYFHDAGALGYPGAFYFQNTILHGELPLWNPYSHCGVPMLAQMGTWYPATFLCALLPLPWALNFTLLAHLVLGGCGMFALARRQGADGFAASFAGLAYAFSGVALSCFQWSNYIESLGWLPWVVLAVVEAWRRGGRWLPLAAVFSALQVLTATPELTLLGWMFLAALWLAEWLGGRIKFWPSASRVALVILLAAGITMIQMLPFFDLLAHSQRDTNYQQTRWAMPGWGWANLLVPLFHNYLSPQGNWFQQGQDFLMSYYLGLGVMVLAATGVWLRCNRTVLVMAGAALICWVLALGEAGHLYPIAKKVLPWIGIARYPVKFSILPAFLIPLLAAQAITKIQSGDATRIWRRVILTGGIFSVLAIGLICFARTNPLPFDGTGAMTVNGIVRLFLLGALLTALWLASKWKSSPRRLAVQFGVLGLLLADLITQSPGITPTLPGQIFAPGLWQAAGRPALHPGEGRIMLARSAEQQMLYSRIPDPQLDFLSKRAVEWYNLNLLDSLPKVDGAFTLRPGQFDQIERLLYYTQDASYGDGLLDFLSAAWISDPANPANWIARTNFLPVMTAGQKPEFVSDEAALAAMSSSTFDPRAEVFLPESERGLVTVTNQTSCQLSHVIFRQSQVEASVQAGAPSLVVLSQTYYHLWQAEIDGQPVPLLRANVAFQAVQLPAGTHQLKLSYHDPRLMAGTVISLLSIAVCAVIWRRQPALEKLDQAGRAD